MRRMIPATVVAAALLWLSSLGAAAASPLTTNAQQALQWLQCTQQQANGQIGSGGNPIARSAETALGLAAAGQSASAMQHGGLSLAAYLTSAVSADVGTNGELLLARASQPDAGPTATVAALLQASKANAGATMGEYGTDIYSDALAILGLRAAGQPVGEDAIAFLESQQKSDGGWSADNADQYGEDSNTTALVIQALLSAGVAADDPAIANGFKYMQSVFSQGGFGDAPGLAPDPNSNELAIQAILAAHEEQNSAWASMLNQALIKLAAGQVVAGSDRGAIAGSFSQLFATTLAPSTFLLRPLTLAGISETKLSLLPCAATASTTPTPAAGTVRLAQTGDSPAREFFGGLILLLAGLLALTRVRQRSHAS